MGTVKSISKRRSPRSGAEHAPKVESRALAKGLQLLEALAASGHPMSLVDLASVVALGKPSTLRLLQTLVTTGFASRDATGAYLLNRRWVPSATEDWLRELIAAAHGPMFRLNADLAETVSLAALSEDHIRVTHVLESPRHIRLSNYEDRILPPYASSLGKAIAAYQTPEKLQVLLQVYGIYPFTEHTITEPILIREELERVRERGYAVEFEETVPGGCCFGAPIMVPGEPVRASVSLSLPKDRLTDKLEQSIPEFVVEAAAEIAKKLGA